MNQGHKSNIGHSPFTKNVFAFVAFADVLSCINIILREIIAWSTLYKSLKKLLAAAYPVLATNNLFILYYTIYTSLSVEVNLIDYNSLAILFRPYLMPLTLFLRAYVKSK